MPGIFLPERRDRPTAAEAQSLSPRPHEFGLYLGALDAVSPRRFCTGVPVSDLISPKSNALLNSEVPRSGSERVDSMNPMSDPEPLTARTRATKTLSAVLLPTCDFERLTSII